MTSLSFARLAVLACLVVVASPGLAKSMKVPSGSPVASVEIPDSWQVTDTRRGFGVKSPDGEVYFWIESYTPDERAGVVAEHEDYFKKQGVTITGEGKTSTNSGGGATVQATDFPATWKGKPTVLRYLAIDPNHASKRQILLSYWASPEGDKTHDKAMNDIIGSFRPAQ